MRGAWLYGLTATALLAGNSGLPPRASSADYPVQQATHIAAFGAALLPPDQVRKIFSAEISRNWVVVEVGIYPQNGAALDVDFFDFALKIGAEDLVRPGTPQEFASVWQGNRSPFPSRGPRVIGETGVVYSSGRDPVDGRTHGWGTYTGVAVENADPRSSPPPPPPSGPDPAVVEAKARDRALPQGTVTRAIAGYLYFPISSKSVKGQVLEVTYSTADAPVHLVLPKK